jgi:hypothetical protein
MSSSESWFVEQLEQAVEDPLKKGLALIDEAIEAAEARRRFQVDSRGCASITYIDLVDVDDDAPS